MPKNYVIEENEYDKNLGRIVTVVSDRGNRFTINTDVLLDMFIDFVDEEKHEGMMGWTLTSEWYKERLKTIRNFTVI